jgi:acyl carrier protein
MFVVGIGIAVVNGRRRDRKFIDQAQAHMAGRPRRSHDEFARSFYLPDIENIAARVLKVLDELVKVDLAQIQPPDRLEADLKLGSLDSLLLLDLLFRLEKEFHVNFNAESFQQVECVDDLIRTVPTALHAGTDKFQGEKEGARKET